MEQQHRKIIGYRELNQAEIDLMNRIKENGKLLGDLVLDLKAKLNASPYFEYKPAMSDLIQVDQRWVSIGATHLQEGLMALTRAVAKPEFF